MFRGEAQTSGRVGGVEGSGGEVKYYACLLAVSGTVSKSSTTARSNLMVLSNRTQKDTAVVPKSPSSSEAVVDVKPTTAPVVKTTCTMNIGFDQTTVPAEEQVRHADSTAEEGRAQHT